VIAFLSLSFTSGAIDPDGTSTLSGSCKCYIETPKKGELMFRTEPKIAEKNLLSKIKSGSAVILIEKNVSVANGHTWHKVKYNGQTGYVAHWVHCKQQVQSKKSDRTFYGNRLLVDSLAKIKVPDGANNIALVNKWYSRYKTQEYYQGAVRRAWERINQGNNLELIYKECVKQGVPYEVVLLAMIESSWYPHKNNHAGAAGYWQFIPGTAKDYGLVVRPDRDDRLSVEKSTHAAIAYLKDLSCQYTTAKTFSDRWCFAFASYNRGPGKVRTTFKQCGGTFSKYPDKISVDFHETRNYVPKMFGLRKFLKEFLEEKFTTEVYKSPADIAYEGYLEKKKDLARKQKLDMLRIIDGMYREEVSLNHYGEDRDDAYSSGALKEISQEIEELNEQ
jgi:hypothetical protein